MVKIRNIFAESRGSAKLAILAGAMLLALAVTGGVFAVGALTTTNTIGVYTQSENFAKVTANTTNAPSWTSPGRRSTCCACSSPGPRTRVWTWPAAPDS